MLVLVLVLVVLFYFFYDLSNFLFPVEVILIPVFFRNILNGIPSVVMDHT